MLRVSVLVAALASLAAALPQAGSSASPAVCGCVESSASCIVAPGAQDSSLGGQFDYVCSKIDCGPIVNGTLSQCNERQRLTWAFDTFFKRDGQHPISCFFAGDARIRNPGPVAPTCAAPLRAAGLSSLLEPYQKNICNCANDSFECGLSATTNIQTGYAALIGDACGRLGLNCPALIGPPSSPLANCNLGQQTAAVFNAFYIASGRDPQACNWSGAAALKRPVVCDTCKNLIAPLGTSPVQPTPSSEPSSASSEVAVSPTDSPYPV